MTAMITRPVSFLLFATMAMMGSFVVEGFTAPPSNVSPKLAVPTAGSFSSSSSSSALFVGPLQKFTNKNEYNRVVEGLMLTQGISREQAEKEYDAYLDNPNNYALNKGEAYYKSLGYKSLMVRSVPSSSYWFSSYRFVVGSRRRQEI